MSNDNILPASGQGGSHETGIVAAMGRPIRTTSDFANLYLAVIRATINGDVTPAQASAAIRAGEVMLRAIEMQLRFGKPGVPFALGTDQGPEAGFAQVSSYTTPPAGTPAAP